MTGDKADATAATTSRRSTGRSAAEYALLGLIAQSAFGKIHGYDLARSFAESGLGRILRLESGMLYHFLKKMVRDGLITSTLEHQAGRPDRQVHGLTGEGRDALHAWISAPVRATREIRLDFLIKLYLARGLDPARAIALVADQQSVMRTRAARLTEQVDDVQGDDVDNAFGDTVLRLRLLQTRAALDWLEGLPESN